MRVSTAQSKSGRIFKFHVGLGERGMRLLVVTQAVDTADPVLGFFVRWIEELATRVRRVEVICLSKGKHSLPDTVSVHSLGKEKGEKPSVLYALYFFMLAWRLRREYDSVLVHMNQEYLLIAGWLWWLLGKRVYFWRNHYAGSLLTDLAVMYSTKVFCTSKHSYTARYAKTVLMPVGVDTTRFKPSSLVKRELHSILFLARMAPSKRPEVLLDALLELARDGVAFSASFIGSPGTGDESFYAALMERAKPLGTRVSFLPAISHEDTPDHYRAHEIFVNCSRSGMFDKTLFEAAACGCVVLAASDDFAALMPDAHFEHAGELVSKLSNLLTAPVVSGTAYETLAASQSLHILTARLIEEMTVAS